jgi:DNA-binding NarL/FixJ family response regulator
MSYTRSELVQQLAPLMLTPRLIEVLALLLQGESNKVIARDLSLSTETVKEYVATILHRLSVTSRAQIPMSVRSYHETLLAWDVARRERGRPHSARGMTVNHHAF